MRNILESKAHPEMGYRACLGIMSLAKRYTPARVVEAASQRALALRVCSYQSLRWLACALAHRACRDGFFAFKRMSELFRDLALARADGSIGHLLAKLARADVLVLDDFAMAPLKDSGRRDFLEICDDRYQRRSTILTSPVTPPEDLRATRCAAWSPLTEVAATRKDTSRTIFPHQQMVGKVHLVAAQRRRWHVETP